MNPVSQIHIKKNNKPKYRKKCLRTGESTGPLFFSPSVSYTGVAGGGEGRRLVIIVFFMYSYIIVIHTYILSSIGGKNKLFSKSEGDIIFSKIWTPGFTFNLNSVGTTYFN